VTVTPTAELQPRELIVTLFGLYARDEHNWLAVASLVRIMEAVGVDGPAVRSSISRLKRRGVLVSSRQRGAVGYALSPSLLDVVNEGDSRIFVRGRGTLDDGFLLLVFSVPESERDKRHALRSALTKLGYGTVSPGVWIAPAHLKAETRDALQRRGLSGYVEIFEGNPVSLEGLPQKIAQWWDLDTMSDLYAGFIATHRPLLNRYRAGKLTDRDVFAEYVSMLTSWRRLPYLDPGLPLELLPSRWNGVTAEKLFDELHTALNTGARDFALTLIHP